MGEKSVSCGRGCDHGPKDLLNPKREDLTIEVFTCLDLTHLLRLVALPVSAG